jgi:organic hydroperoxide reductase OsmC/OhrA
MTARQHEYRVHVAWRGNTGAGTAGYRAYERTWELTAEGRAPLRGSADPAFLGSAALWNPEELLVASLAACHKLWYLHLCADAGVVVTAYVDDAVGLMEESARGGGAFTEVTLRPGVTITAGSDPATAERLHEAAHEKCFIAASVRFPVTCQPRIACGPEMGEPPLG